MDRRNEGAVAADKSMIANASSSLGQTVIGNAAAAAEIDLNADIRIADVALMGNGRSSPKVAFLISTKLPTRQPLPISDDDRMLA